MTNDACATTTGQPATPSRADACCRTRHTAAHARPTAAAPGREHVPPGTRRAHEDARLARVSVARPADACCPTTCRAADTSPDPIAHGGTASNSKSESRTRGISPGCNYPPNPSNLRKDRVCERWAQVVYLCREAPTLWTGYSHPGNHRTSHDTEIYWSEIEISKRRRCL